MSMLRRAGVWLQGALYIAAGINHFWHTQMYVKIMPPHYDHPVGLVQLSGMAEVLGGVGLLVPQTRRVAAWGIVAMLLVYFDVHLYMAQHPERFVPVPAWVIYGRLPLQFVLIAWAAAYGRREPEESRVF